MRFSCLSPYPTPALSFQVFSCAVSVIACFLFFVPLARAQQNTLEGQRIAEVRVVDESGDIVAEKVPNLPLKAGDLLDYSAERESLRVLYRMGDYSSIRVTAAPQTQGLRVDFIVQRNFFNNVIRIEGLKPPPTEPAARSALRLNLGEPFRESDLRGAVERLQQSLRDDGLYLAKITYTLDPHMDTRQMDVTVNIEPGPRARVGDITAENKTPYPEHEVLRRAKISGKKKELTSQRITRATDSLRKFLVDQGYLGAGAAITRGSYDAPSDSVPLTIAVETGPRVRVEITGARLRASVRKRLLPIYAEGAVDEDLLQEGRRNIRDYLQSQGYFDADVEVRSAQDDQNGERVITYDIKRGDSFRLAGIDVVGNVYFRAELLTRRLQLQQASFASKGRYSQQLMRGDADAIRAVYLSNGFRDAQVTPTVENNYRGKKNNLFVSFHVVEGMQTRVTDLQILGAEAIPVSELQGVVGSTAGEPYSEAGVASDRNNILAVYYNEGFPEAEFHEEVIPGATPNEVRLIYRVTEGRRIEVAKVLLTGYQYTRPGIIARQVAIAPGGPVREGDVATTQRQLYNLGVFTRVQIAPQNPDGSDPEKTMVVEVQEGQRYTIGYGFGFEVQRIAGGTSNPNGSSIGASPRGIFEIARENMFGRAQTLSFKARVSTLEYRVGISYVANNFLAKRNLSLQFTGYADKTQDINTFTSTRLEGGMQLVQQISPSTSLLYRYFYRRVEASNINSTIDPEQIPLLSQPTLVSGFGLTYARDRRNDPADATRGSFNTVDISYAAKPLGSGASFFRGSFQNSTYHTFGRNFVFARSVRFGVEQPTGDTDAEEIPLPERFFAGGGTTLRGFGLNQAGPRDPVTGFPIGGLAMLIFNQELRFPMKLPFVGNRLGGTIFYDGGNVYTDVNNISFAWKSPSLTNLNYFSHTVGFGLRYPTPVGPVRVDFGYQLNPASYQATNTTTQQMEVLHLPHFGFSFNIGAIF